VLPADPAIAVPACIDGRRACPPEDCGGPWGCRELLKILAEPNHPAHDERREWLGRRFDPEFFDRSSSTTNLRTGRLIAFDDEP
jgi:hypothetical protein